MKQYFVYLLESQKDGSHYIGQTSDLDLRIDRHNRGKVLSTNNKRPWKMIKFEIYATRNEARWREYSLKHNSNERNKFYGD